MRKLLTSFELEAEVIREECATLNMILLIIYRSIMYESSSENNITCEFRTKYIYIYMFNKLYTHNYTLIFYYKTHNIVCYENISCYTCLLSSNTT